MDYGLSTVATDDYCTNWNLKVEGNKVSDVTGGHNGIETSLVVTFSEGVSRQKMSLERFVEVTSSNAAKIMGMYPQKGLIAPGSDADIVLIDPSFDKNLEMSDFHISDYSIWEGFHAQGWPVTTILRGNIVVEDRKLVIDQKLGKLVKRKVSSTVLNRPVC